MNYNNLQRICNWMTISRTKERSTDILQRIVAFRKNGLSLEEISKQLQISRQSVATIVRKYKLLERFTPYHSREESQCYLLLLSENWLGWRKLIQNSRRSMFNVKCKLLESKCLCLRSSEFCIVMDSGAADQERNPYCKKTFPSSTKICLWEYG